MRAFPTLLACAALLALVPAVAAQPYAPPSTYAVGGPVVRSLLDSAALGGPREVRVAMRYPVGAPGPRPVVVWSHGGSTGKTNPLRSGPAWGEALAAAGYVVFSVAHPARRGAPMQALCQHVGYATAPACRAGFRSLQWDRAHDQKAVLDAVERMAARAPWRDRIDPERIAVAGHSAGSGAAAQLAGALRTVGTLADVSAPDPRPEAFLLLALQGPGGQAGFRPDAWGPIDRPVFGATGAGDVTQNQDPKNRVRAFDSIRSKGSQLLFLDDRAAAHTLFNLEPAACERRGGAPAHCAAMADVVRTSAVAFLDAHLLGRRAAAAWLASDDVAQAAGGPTWVRP